MGLGLGLGGLLLLSLTGCSAQVAVARFPERPDSSAPGDLLGPFDGEVIDQATGNPVSAALVLGTWSFERAAASSLATPLFSKNVEVLTGNDGSYRIPRVSPPSDPAALLSRFTIVIYKAGYQGYRSDNRPEDGTVRHDFAQRRAKILLARFPEGASHAKHLAFLGGGEALRRAAQAEVVQASLELAEGQPALVPPKKEPEKPPPAPPPPSAASLLRLTDVTALPTAKGLVYSENSLAQGQEPEGEGTPIYDGVHYKAKAKQESFDVALRLWQFADLPAAEAGFDKAKGALGPLLTKDPKSQVPPKGTTFARAFDPKRRIHGLLILTLFRQPPVLLQLTCGASLCARQEQADSLLAGILARLAPESDGK